WRHADVIQPDFLEEMNRRGVAPVLTADAELDVRPRLSALFHRGADQEADANRVNRAERILVENFLVLVRPKELADVVAREPERGLRQIVGAERKELRL